MDASALQAIFERTALEAGYLDAEASVQDHVLLKVKWVRTNDWIHIGVSDYLQALSPDAAAALAEHVLAKICGEDRGAYPQPVTEELMSEEFALANRETFLQRLARLGVEDGGDVPALADYEALAQDQGVAIPSSIRVLLAPPRYDGETVFPMMRVALMPRSVARSSKAARLAWIEDAVVKIGRGPGVPDAPEHYVEVA